MTDRTPNEQILAEPETAAARKAWATPRVILATLSSETLISPKSFPSIPDTKAPATTPFGS